MARNLRLGIKRRLKRSNNMVREEHWSTMEDFLTYKGYKGTIEYSKSRKMYFGHVIKIQSIVSYDGKTKEILKKNFQSAIDDYISFSNCS